MLRPTLAFFTRLFMVIFLFTSCATNQSRFPASGGGVAGNPGTDGSVGDSGQGGSIDAAAFISASKPIVQFHFAASRGDLNELKRFLYEGLPVNESEPMGETVFQQVVRTRRTDALRLLLTNSDVQNRPDLRTRYSAEIDGRSGLNIYEVLLYANAIEDVQGDPPIRVNRNELTKLILDDRQIAMLQMLISFDTNSDALKSETREVLNYIKNSPHAGASTMESAVQILESL